MLRIFHFFSSNKQDLLYEKISKTINKNSDMVECFLSLPRFNQNSTKHYSVCLKEKMELRKQQLYTHFFLSSENERILRRAKRWRRPEVARAICSENEVKRNTCLSKAKYKRGILIKSYVLHIIRAEFSFFGSLFHTVLLYS